MGKLVCCLVAFLLYLFFLPALIKANFVSNTLCTKIDNPDSPPPAGCPIPVENIAPAPCGAAITNTTDFSTLMAGQGRCIAILGDENSFVTAVIKNNRGRLSITGKEAELHQIYQQATAVKINPLITLTMWGVESGWSTKTTILTFGCLAHYANAPRGFAGQLPCSVSGLNRLMNEFDSKAKRGLPVHLDEKASCTYTDEFLYGYERYTPVCGVYDHNDSSRTNFVNYYKIFLGVK